MLSLILSARFAFATKVIQRIKSCWRAFANLVFHVHKDPTLLWFLGTRNLFWLAWLTCTFSATVVSSNFEGRRIELQGGSLARKVALSLANLLQLARLGVLLVTVASLENVRWSAGTGLLSIDAVLCIILILFGVAAFVAKVGFQLHEAGILTLYNSYWQMNRRMSCESFGFII